MKKMKSIKLTNLESFWHYSIIFFLLIIPVFSMIDLLKYYVLDNYTGKLTIYQMSSGLIVLVPIVIVYFIQKKKLRFTEINISVTRSDFEKAIRETADELSWKKDELKDGYFRGHRKWDMQFSWGEMITIVHEKDRIYFNSICDPNAIFISVVSYGWNKRNMSVFLENLKNSN